MASVRATMTIRNRLGLHARPAMEFVDVASCFTAAVTVTREDQTVDGKSIMQMMLLAATQGTTLEVLAEGDDADAAMAALADLVNSGFGEDD